MEREEFAAVNKDNTFKEKKCFSRHSGWKGMCVCVLSCVLSNTDHPH